MKKLLLALPFLALLFLPHSSPAQFNGCLPGFCGARISGGGSSLSCSYTPVTTGTQGVAYTGGTPVVTGGAGGNAFSNTGTLPASVSTNTSTGVIGGTPTNNGTFTSIQLKVTDSASTVANCGSAFTLTIAPSATFALTFNQTATNSGGTGAVNFGPMNYTSGATRVIVAINILSGSATTTITGVTIGGVALAHVSGTFALPNAVAGQPITDIWQSTGPLSGSSGTVIVTVSDSMNPFGSTGAIATYSLTTTTPTASSSNSGTTSNNTTTSAALTVPSGGGGLAISQNSSGPTGGTISSTANDATAGSQNGIFTHTTATGSLTPTATYSVSGGIALSVAGWGP